MKWASERHSHPVGYRGIDYRTPRKIGRVGGTHQLGGTRGRNDAGRSHALKSQWDQQIRIPKKSWHNKRSSRSVGEMRDK